MEWLEKQCKECGKTFYAIFFWHEYCGIQCKRKTNNRTYYASHSESVIQRVINYRRSKSV